MSDGWTNYFDSWCDENDISTTDWRCRMRKSPRFAIAKEQWESGASDRVIQGQLLRAKLDTIPQEQAI